ncbi:type IV pilin protein [Pseudomonas sp. LP_7_YM]|uniref:type IV pilin protein n=1 Tax=Pseudomonas sp. LP_7_YM TaxID=2485137 RepID=UPI0010DBC1B3|nr:type IV pilin protein [Pseudomonas sp. LP_7_YM]TDV65789.1 type IV pilus assembly protein PilE [Pseudomonas sp. LP_7_YM]
MTLRDRQKMRYLKTDEHGFTLIELMITVAIVAILAAIAYPSYTKYVQRGYRSEGIAMLSDAVARMERYYAQNNTYVGATLSTLGLSTDSKVTTLSSANSKYTLSFSGTPGATTYTLQVVPQDSQAKDTCGTMTINQAGAKTPTTAECWR